MTMEPEAVLALSPDGRHVAVLAADRIRMLDREAGSELGVLAGSAVALFDRAVWTIDPNEPIVRRHSIGDAGELTEIGTARLPAGRALERVTYGANAALWLAPQPILIEAREDRLVATPLAFELVPGERLSAMTVQRFVRTRRGEVALLDAAGRVRWSFDAGGGTEVVMAAPLFEGRWVSAIVGRRGASEQQLLLLDGRDGRVQHRLALRGVTAARFTALRGLAVLRADASHLIVVDLRFGKVLRHHEEPREIADLAIDDAGQRVVLQFADGEIVDANVADLLAGRLVTSVMELEPVPMEPVAPPPPAPEPPPPPAAPSAPLQATALLALRPREPGPRCTAGELAALLDGHRELVAALAARAIAIGWDSGAIAFVDDERPPFEREVAAVVLGVRGLATVQLRKTQEAVDLATARLRELEQIFDGRHAIDPLTELARDLGLDELDRRLLVLIAAPTFWGELTRLYGILANDERRAPCDEQLLVQMCGTSERSAITHALDRDRPLVKHGLVQVATDRARPFATVSVDPLVLRILRGDPLDVELDRGVELAPPAPALETLIAPRPALRRVLDALARPEPSVRIVVCGRVGSGRRSIVGALAARAGRRVGTVDAGLYLREQRLDRLATVLRRTALRGWIPLVDGLEHADEPTRAAVLEIVRDHPGPLALRIPHGATLRLPASYLELDLPALTIGQGADHWQARLGAAGIAIEDVDTLAARFRVGPGVIDRCVESLGERSEDPLHDVEHAMRRHLASRLGEVATRVDRLPTWSQVVLPEDIEDSVLELIARIRFQRTVYDTWGFDQIMTTSRGVTALFQGPPGTGKTLVAGAIANELGLDLYRIDVSRVMSKWIGETEQNLAKAFAAAEESQAILLFDEADSLFAKRTEVKSSNDRYANTEVNYLLQRLDSFEGIAILTTNFGSSIDAAFKRRLSFRLTFPFPDDETREQLWKAHLPARLPRAGELDLRDLARRFRMSGGYIRNAALRAAFLAAEERCGLTQDHLERAIRAEFREIGNLADTGVLA